MNKQCLFPDCHAPDTTCPLGELHPESCTEFRKSVSLEDNSESRISNDALVLPWSGNTLGAADRSFVSARTCPRVIAVIGPAKAGKTTMLAAWYLVTGRGAVAAGHTFSGSYTLTGWENIAHAMRWSSSGGPSFPPHTSSGAGRVPGVLHMAFRDAASGSTDDLFFVDAPGEWFRAWAVNRDASEAEGARWIAEHADAFLIIADSEALAGPERGGARNVLTQIIQRVGHERAGRPVAIVWAKSDIAVPEAMKTSIETAVAQHVGSHQKFSWSVKPHGEADAASAFATLLGWAITARGEGSCTSINRNERSKDHFMALGHDR